MRTKKFLSMLLVLCTIIGMIPTISLAEDSDPAAATNYHIFTALPTTEGAVTDATLYLGASFNGVFYGMNSLKQGSGNSSYYTTTDAVSQQYTITVRYAGNDATYGDYYNLIFTQPGGSAYTVAYDSGFFSQNKIQDSGTPSGGWAYKHRLYWEAEAQLFYHRPNADKTVRKGLKLSSTSYRLFVETVENLKNENTAYSPARLYEICTSDNIAGSNATHTWSGSCTCGYQFDYKEKTEESFVGYHPETELPTETNPKISGNLYLGAVLSETFYGMNGSGFSSNAATTSTDLAEQNTIAILYGGEDETYGSYYYVTFTLPNGTAYSFAYAGGNFTQNKLIDGLPSGGWAAKHKLFYDAEAQLFYHRPAADMTVMKGLKLSTTSHKLFTETVEKLKVASPDYVPVRLYALCTAEGEAGSDSTHHWSGICSCGDKVDFAQHDQITDWNVKVAEGHGKVCSCGFALEATKPHDMPEQWTEDTDTGLVYKICTSCGYRELKDHTHQYTTQQYDETNHWNLCVCGDISDVTEHSFGQWNEVIKPTMLSEGTDMRQCESCAYSETRQTRLQQEDFFISANPPAANVPFYLGATQLQVENTPTYFFKGAWAPNSYLNMDTATDVQAAKVMYAEEAQGGYKLYFDSEGVKTYLVIQTKVVNEKESVYVQPVTDANDASVFQWNSQYATFQTNVAGKGDYYIGLYTDDKGTAYTKLQALLVSGLGREDRHPGKVYMNTDAVDHTHSFGDWVVLSTPAHLQENGKEERSCTICGYVEIRMTTMLPEDFVESSNPPAANVPFYLGATQLQVENTPTYFFKGAWAPSEYLNMDTTKDMYAAKAMYAEEAQGGYKLYFDNEGVKTYLVIQTKVVNEKESVYVQPVTDANDASVFQWNGQYATFQTNVAGKGDYYIGLYTDDKGTAYTKLQALLVSGLGREDRHPGKVYMNTNAADHTHSFGDWVVLSVPTHLQEQGKEKRSCNVCGYEEIRVISMSAEDFVESSNPPAANVPFYLGATQLQVENTPTYFFKGAWAPSKYLNMDVTTDMYSAKAMYAEEVADGYKLYFDNEGVKTYLVIDNMTVSESTGVYVQPVTDSAKASVFKWNSQYATFQTNVAGKGDYYIGLYTDDKGTAYTKLQALLVSGLGREDRHPGKVYTNTNAADHTHSFGDWVVLSVPNHLQEQGKEKRGCKLCDYEQIRITTLSTDEFVASVNPPATNVPFYLGATQLQIKDKPTYFFKGTWAPSKYLNMDVTTDMYGAKAMYAEAVNGGYKLYFDNVGVKTYLVIANTKVSGSKGVFVQPVMNSRSASVFLWNQEYGTFYTNVPGKGDYYIGLYTDDKGTAYTKLQALLVTGLDRNDRHPGKVYLRTYDHKHTFGGWVSKSRATHLNDQGVQERVCAGCGYVQARVVMLSAKDYTPATRAPRAGSSFYLGATQLQIENTPAYFFLGEWLPRKLQRMDVTDNMMNSALMYSQAVEGGYKLFFMNEGVKTYLTIAEMTVEGDRSVFVQPVTDSAKASVFQWNQQYRTFQTSVEGKGEYCIGNYTDGDIKYTKLSALPVSELESDDFHPVVPYVLK